jgi:hypothetical protein
VVRLGDEPQFVREVDIGAIHRLGLLVLSEGVHNLEVTEPRLRQGDFHLLHRVHSHGAHRRAQVTGFAGAEVQTSGAPEVFLGHAHPLLDGVHTDLAAPFADNEGVPVPVNLPLRAHDLADGRE